MLPARRGYQRDPSAPHVDMEPERRHPVGRMLVAALAAVLGAGQVVLVLVWLMRNPEPSAQMFLAVPWLVLWWCIALVAARATRRHSDPVDPGA
jgi:Flp pilus assembly protein TadB